MRRIRGGAVVAGMQVLFGVRVDSWSRMAEPMGLARIHHSARATQATSVRLTRFLLEIALRGHAVGQTA
jgi:hypothetical protein